MPNISDGAFSKNSLVVNYFVKSSIIDIWDSMNLKVKDSWQRKSISSTSEPKTTLLSLLKIRLIHRHFIIILVISYLLEFLIHPTSLCASSRLQMTIIKDLRLTETHYANKLMVNKKAHIGFVFFRWSELRHILVSYWSRSSHPGLYMIDTETALCKCSTK